MTEKFNVTKIVIDANGIGGRIEFFNKVVHRRAQTDSWRKGVCGFDSKKPLDVIL